MCNIHKRPIRKSNVHTIGNPEGEEKGEKGKKQYKFPKNSKEIEPSIPEVL